MMNEINDILFKIIHKDEKCLDLLLQMDVDLFTSFEKKGFKTSLFAVLLLCDTPDLFNKTKEKFLKQYNDKPQQSENLKKAFYHNIICTSSTLFEDKNKRYDEKNFDNVFELLSMTKNSWNIKALSDLMEESRFYLDEELIKEKEVDKSVLLDKVIDKFFMYTDFSPLWYSRLFRSDESQRNYQNGGIAFLDGIIDFCQCTKKDLISIDPEEKKSLLSLFLGMDQDCNNSVALEYLIAKFDLTKKDDVLYEAFINCNLAEKEFLMKLDLDMDKPLKNQRYPNLNCFLDEKIKQYQKEIVDYPGNDKELEGLKVTLAVYEKLTLTQSMLSAGDKPKTKNRL